MIIQSDQIYWFTLGSLLSRCRLNLSYSSDLRLCLPRALWNFAAAMTYMVDNCAVIRRRGQASLEDEEYAGAWTSILFCPIDLRLKTDLTQSSVSSRLCILSVCAICWLWVMRNRNSLPILPTVRSQFCCNRSFWPIRIVIRSFHKRRWTCCRWCCCRWCSIQRFQLGHFDHCACKKSLYLNGDVCERTHTLASPLLDRRERFLQLIFQINK